MDIHKIVFAGLFGCLATAGTSEVHSEPALSIATGEYAPFTDSTAADGGLTNALVAQIADQADFEVQFEYMPWMRALELTRAGRFDATSFWYFSEERDADFIHVGPVLQDRLVFFHRVDTAEPLWESLEDLSAYKIGAVTGYTYTPEFWQLGDEGSLSIEIAPNDEANLRKLFAGRIDLFPMGEESGWLLIETLFSEEEQAQFEASSQALAVTDGYLLVSRAIENAEQIAAALQDQVDAIGQEMN